MNGISPEKTNLERLRNALETIPANNLSDLAKNGLEEARLLVEAASAEMETIRTEAQTVKQDKAKFISVVTHELRLPLTSIKGYTDLMRQGIVGPVNDQQKNFLNVIRNNVDRMSSLISDLSDMSHIQSGRLEPQPKPGNLVDLVEEVLYTWRPRLEEKNQTVSVEIDPAIPIFMLDPARFVQVLGYILSNAHRYSPSGGMIFIRARKEGDMARLEVQDNGIGISEEDHKQLFTPFFRSEDSAVRELPGWGLALHVARLLVELMGGQIGASSHLRQGSTFWFSLPVIQT